MHSLLNHPSLMDCRRLFLREHDVWINEQPEVDPDCESMGCEVFGIKEGPT